MSLPFLQQFGLTENEAGIYEALLRLGEVPAWQVVQEVKLKRPTVYKALYNLEKLGLVTKNGKAKVIRFAPSSPQKLLELADLKFTSLERAKENLTASLPQLTSSYILSVEKPVVRTYEGIEGIKQAHLEILSAKKEILAFVAINEDIDKQLGTFWKKYFRTRKKNNIFAKVISPNKKGAKEYQQRDKDELRETRIVPVEKFPINIEKDIVGNKVAFFSSQENKLIVTIIENKPIADTERAMFELAWEQAKRYNDQLKAT